MVLLNSRSRNRQRQRENCQGLNPGPGSQTGFTEWLGARRVTQPMSVCVEGRGRLWIVPNHIHERQEWTEQVTHEVHNKLLSTKHNIPNTIMTQEYHYGTRISANWNKTCFWPEILKETQHLIYSGSYSKFAKHGRYLNIFINQQTKIQN